MTLGRREIRIEDFGTLVHEDGLEDFGTLGGEYQRFYNIKSCGLRALEHRYSRIKNFRTT